MVPIHSLGVDATHAPLLVMKRIEGTSWSELLRDERHPAWASLLLGHGDRLRANVDILVQVSRALSFAHDRGIVHRDLKPDNVMIGRFGEVYLLDWGIAIRLTEREAEPRNLVGTPSYMAPEMAHGDPLPDRRAHGRLPAGWRACGSALHTRASTSPTWVALSSGRADLLRGLALRSTGSRALERSGFAPLDDGLPL